MSEELAGKFPCPLCGDGLPVQTTKKGKPYFVCQRCGMQLFIRYPDGIEVLKKTLAKYGNGLVSSPGKGYGRTIAIVSTVNRLLQLKQTLADLEEQQGLFSKDEDLDKAAEAVIEEIKQLREQLREAKKD